MDYVFDLNSIMFASVGRDGTSSTCDICGGTHNTVDTVLSRHPDVPNGEVLTWCLQCAQDNHVTVDVDGKSVKRPRAESQLAAW